MFGLLFLTIGFVVGRWGKSLEYKKGWYVCANTTQANLRKVGIEIDIK